MSTPLQGFLRSADKLGSESFEPYGTYCLRVQAMIESAEFSYIIEPGAMEAAENPDLWNEDDEPWSRMEIMENEFQDLEIECDSRNAFGLLLDGFEGALGASCFGGLEVERMSILR